MRHVRSAQSSKRAAPKSNQGHKTIAITGRYILSSLILLGTASFSATRADFQCRSGYGFAFCPDAHVLFVLNDSSLKAVDTSAEKVNWHIDLPSDKIATAPEATNATIAFVTGATPSTIEAFDNSTGRRTWKVNSKTTALTASSGMILANTDDWEGVIAIDSRTGRIRWRHTGRFRSYIHFLDSSRSTVLTNLFSIDAPTGRVLTRWQSNEQATAGAFSGTNPILGTSSGSVVAYSAATSKILWSKQLFSAGAVNVIAANPEYVVVVGYDAHLFQSGVASVSVLKADGTGLWSKQIRVSGQLLPASSTIVGEIVVFMRQDAKESSVTGFNIASGQQLWELHSTSKLREGIVCDSTTCYVGSESGNVFRINTKAGSASWILPN
jgi:outer membrane protein assembly factor BamB